MLASKLPHDAHERGRLSRGIDRLFKAISGFYSVRLRWLVTRPWIAICGVLVLVGLGIVTFRSVPAEFAPTADLGRAYIQIEGPEGSSFDYIDGYATELESLAFEQMERGDIARVVLRVPGQGGANIRTGDVNTARAFVIMQPWEERDRTPRQVVEQIRARAQQEMPGVRVLTGQPAGLGRRGVGKPVQAVIGGPDYERLAEWSERRYELAQANPGLISVETSYKARKPQIRVSIDRDRAADLGISLQTVGRTLETMLGSRIVTTYVERGREYN